MRMVFDEDEGGVSTEGGTVFIIPQYLDLNWMHSEGSNPAGALKGFRLVVFTGTDPDAGDAYLIAPVELGPTETRFVKRITPKADVTINAAIKAVYFNGQESAWRTPSGTVDAVADTTSMATSAELSALATPFTSTTDGLVPASGGSPADVLHANGVWAPGGDLTFAHNQTTPASVWTITHGLGKYPSITVVTSAGGSVYGEIHYDDINTVTLTFSSEFSGKAYLN